MRRKLRESRSHRLRSFWIRGCGIDVLLSPAGKMVSLFLIHAKIERMKRKRIIGEGEKVNERGY